jgi:hypothetical protein
MKLPKSMFSVLCALIFCSQAVQAGDKVPPGFEALFNGKDFYGWHGMGHFDPRKLAAMSDEQRDQKRESDLESLKQHWTIEGDEIVNDGQGVYLTSDREFGDMELLIEYKTAAKADSGIYLRATPQVQIWDFTKQGGQWENGADKGSGGLWNNSAGAAGKDPLVLGDRPFGQWNQLRIQQVGARTTVWLNDQLVVNGATMENFWDRQRPLFAKGPIQLQTHGGEIRWRNIVVREILPDEANRILAVKNSAGFRPLFNGHNFEGWAGAVENYEIVNGTIRCKPGHGGILHTAEPLEDFIVRLEFKLPPGGNNGLAIRYPGKGSPHADGLCELQVLDNSSPQYSKLDPRQYHGSAYGMVAAKRGYLRPPGTWNSQEVTVQGSKIRVELNGTIILDADLSEVTEFKDGTSHPGKDLRRGYFGFAGHHDPVEFRNIRVREL